MSGVMHHTRLGPEHLQGNNGIGRYVLFPGDFSRAARLATAFQNVQRVENPRGHTGWMGTIEVEGRSIDMLSIASGMGTGSTEVILHELLAVGARRVVRVGSCGAMCAGVRPGGVVVVTGAVRDEATSGHYVPPQFPAVAAPEGVMAFSQGALDAGLGAWTWRGLCHTKDSLYAREFGHGPAGAANLAYKEHLSRAGVVASDMEASAIFVMCGTWKPAPVPDLASGSAAVAVQGACVLAVYAGHDSDMNLDEDVVEAANQRAMAVTLAGIARWARIDGLIG